MTDREHRDEFEDDEEHEESHLDTSETSGLGFTEEFKRLEQEIGTGFDSGEQPAAPTPPEAAGSEGEPPSDTAEEWVHQEEEHGADDAGRYGETGEHDSIPETGEWTAEYDAVPEPPADEDADSAEHPVVRPEPAAAESAEPEPDAPAEPEAEQEPPVEPQADEAEAGESQEQSGQPSASDAETVVQRPEEGAEAPIAAAAAQAASRPAQDAPTEVRRPGEGLTPIPPSAGRSGPPAISDEELDPKVPSLWLRFLSGSVLIVMSVAASVAVAGLLFLSDVAAKLQPIPGIQDQLDQVESDDPQTILIVGSDKRASDPKGAGARSDTAMLLRVDPDKKVLSLFSLPRDLKVNIPGYGVGKLNEAYTVGGVKKTLKTVSAFTGVPINHVVEINFQGFADAVNAIGCVYIDVDRAYFNDNSQAMSEEDKYAEININAGYQRLCGLKALQYVRYRHTDTDLVRAARQQDFLREARQKVEPRELIPAPVVGGDAGNELIDIFTSYTRSDISNSSDVVGILKSFIAVRDVPVNKIEFKGDIGDATNTYVTSTSEQVEEAMDEFLNGPGGDNGSSGSKGGGKSKDKKKDKKKDPTADATVIPTSEITDPTTGEPMSTKLEKDARKNFRRLRIPVFYPTALVPGSAFDTASRTYDYKNEDDKKEEGYKTVIEYRTPSTLTEYYGFMGTTWDDPPILRNPSEVRKIDGREFMLFYDGDRLRMVGWKEKGNSYWLNNTLTQSISEADMLAMAASLKQYKP